jgi:putative flippase GtrA
VTIPFLKFNKFVLTNFCGTIVDTIVLWYSSNFLFHNYTGKYVLAPTISFEFAVLNNYILSYFWIWNERVHKKTKDFFQRYFFYNINSTITFIIKLGLIIGIERISHFHVVYCNLIALGFTGILNYYIQDKLVFRKAKIKA